MWVVVIILDDPALEHPPEKKFEDPCVRQPGPEEAAGRNGGCSEALAQSPPCFSVLNSYNLKRRGSARPLGEENKTGGKAPEWLIFDCSDNQNPNKGRTKDSKQPRALILGEILVPHLGFLVNGKKKINSK